MKHPEYEESGFECVNKMYLMDKEEEDENHDE